jgi:hypothetical protein
MRKLPRSLTSRNPDSNRSSRKEKKTSFVCGASWHPASCFCTFHLANVRDTAACDLKLSPLEITARHEAGHALAHLVLPGAIPPRYAVVNPKTDGGAVYFGGGNALNMSKAEIERAIRRLPRQPQDLQTRREWIDSFRTEAMLLFAGPIAGDYVLGVEADAKALLADQHTVDNRIVPDAVQAMCFLLRMLAIEGHAKLSPRRELWWFDLTKLEAAAAEVVLETRAVVVKHWPAIERLAAALLERRRLGYRAMVDIVESRAEPHL